MLCGVRYLIFTMYYIVIGITSRAYSNSSLCAIITCNHQPFFKIFLNFVHFCPNFQIFHPFFSKIAPKSLLSRIGPNIILKKTIWNNQNRNGIVNRRIGSKFLFFSNKSINTKFQYLYHSLVAEQRKQRQKLGISGWEKGENSNSGKSCQQEKWRKKCGKKKCII